MSSTKPKLGIPKAKENLKASRYSSPYLCMKMIRAKRDYLESLENHYINFEIMSDKEFNQYLVRCRLLLVNYEAWKTRYLRSIKVGSSNVSILQQIEVIRAGLKALLLSDPQMFRRLDLIERELRLHLRSLCKRL